MSATRRSATLLPSDLSGVGARRELGEGRTGGVRVDLHAQAQHGSIDHLGSDSDDHHGDAVDRPLGVFPAADGIRGSGAVRG